MVGTWPTLEIFFLCQLEEILVSLRWVLLLGYIVLSKKISIEAKKIKVVKGWPEPKSVCNI